MLSLDELNSKQKEAVLTTEGPVLIIAGPGSGKTKVLTFRTAHLIEKGIASENILAVTFTNKAAQEMKAKLQLLLTGPSRQSASWRRREGPITGTFHAFCAQILRSELDYLPSSLCYPSSKFIIYDENDSRELLKKILKESNIPDNYFKPTSVLDNISRAKSDLINAEEYTNQAEGFYPQTISQIYNLYQTALSQANALDFDDLIMLTVQIFQKAPEVLQKYQEKIKYIMVDEYQDTNHAQYVLVNLLAEKYKNICAIGDEAQSIYSWRGADIRNILNFKKDYPEMKIILLEQNYRSTQNIINAAHAVIANNTSRLEKNLWTKNAAGQPLMVYQAKNEKDEAEFIASEINKLKQEEGCNFNDFAILYRTNAQSRPIEEIFLQYGFPYKIIGGVKFYNRKEIKDILAIFRLTQNPNDLISFERLTKIPLKRQKAKIKKDIIKNYLEDLRQINKNYSLSHFLKLSIEKFDYKNYILDGTPIGENKPASAKASVDRWENIQELFTVIKDYTGLPWSEALKIFLAQAALRSTHDEVETKNNLINLMTFHSAKGLEFPVVFMAGCEEGILPYSKSCLNPSEIEEERRLCYVGITRAKKFVYLTFADQRNFRGSTYINQPSRFLGEIPDNLIKRLFI